MKLLYIIGYFLAGVVIVMVANFLSIGIIAKVMQSRFAAMFSGAEQS